MASIPSRTPIHIRRFVFVWVAMTALAFLIDATWGAMRLPTVMLEGCPIAEQIGWGVALGLGFSVPLYLGVSFLRWFSSFRTELSELARYVDLGGLNPLWISTLAGFGEELLFRGALQPVVGLWWASLLFTIAHYRGPINGRRAAHASFFFVGGLLLGYVFLKLGLIAAICAHMSIDLVALSVARRLYKYGNSPTPWAFRRIGGSRG